MLRRKLIFLTAFVGFSALLVLAMPTVAENSEPAPTNNNRSETERGQKESADDSKQTGQSEANSKDAKKNDKAGSTDSSGRKRVIPRRSSAASRAKGEINFDDLVFDLEKDAPFEEKLITKDIKELHNKKVKLRGYILPSTLFRDTDIDRFVLVRDNQECCFGPGAALYDCVMVEMVSGKTTDFVTRPVTVEGKFEIDTKTYRYPGGKSRTGASHLAVFRIRGEKVK